jgi:hypothetical protein
VVSSSAFGSYAAASRDPSEIEHTISKKIIELIKNFDATTDARFEDDNQLTLVESEIEENVRLAFEPLHGPQSLFEYDFIVKVMGAKEQGASFKVISHNFPRVKHSSYLSRVNKYLANMGTAREKYRLIAEYVWAEFEKCCRDSLAVHDRDIKRWALAKSRTLNLPDFIASDTWIKAFKRNNGIVSRRVTKFITTRHQRNREEIENCGVAFHVDFEATITPKGFVSKKAISVPTKSLSSNCWNKRTDDMSKVIS